MNPAAILGIGAITPLGRDLATIADRLSSSPTVASERRVDDELLKDPVLGKALRRADRFTRMAVLAASDAWNAAASTLVDVPRERIGLIVSSGFGPHGRGFKFLDGLLDFGDESALPTDFSHSVHGTPAAYITELLGLRGPSLSITDFVAGFEHALQLAQCWLAERTSDRVLVGAVEELGPVLLHCAGRMLPDLIVPGEGAVFFMLSRDSASQLGNIDVGSEADYGFTLRGRFGDHPSAAAYKLLCDTLVCSRIDSTETFRPSCDLSLISQFVRQFKNRL